ncbi:multidrug efflux pump [Tistlia consotensis]|uniref:Multidrug efflux pump n=1 Tax=Tistlia consotensis USBA 355 TaxID=560819 RepID=A0A1Y6CMY8_9PROT|nr:efflux RND transporter permease subunit [Tistlia consotensis]SMF77248.1 multidrug efflux pump [Tistlia consotensis USBA 355]SNS14545.1 multidrug efflux pump [Tistlia consotensis]
MMLSDLSVKRPVVAAVMSLLIVAFGLVAFQRLPLREYPDIDPPVVTIDTEYPGAAAQVIETRITEVIEDRIAGIEGIAFIESYSEDGRSRISIEFNANRDVNAAANDIRDRVSGVVDNLPADADPPDIQKADSSDDVIIWLNLASDRMNVLQLTDYADRYLVDRFSTLDGVARVRVGGGQTYAMRIWLDRLALAARGLTVADVEDALRADNVELPAGSIESVERNFTARIERSFRNADDFARLVLKRGADGYLVRLGDVARVEQAAVETRTFFRGNGEPMVGIGVIKQSQANTLDVARAVRELSARINPTLPQGMELRQSYDSSVFIQGAVDEVYKTLAIAIVLVVSVIYLFLGSVRAMLVPAVTVPVCIVGTFIVLFALGFSINLLTLLALVLAIGLVVDDAIVVLENIHRRIEDEAETPLVAAFRGTRQVGFAVIATTAVVIAVFVPITFIQGDLGRLFSEFAITMAAAVFLSAFVALSLSPMIASKVLKQGERASLLVRLADRGFAATRLGYQRLLRGALRLPWLAIPAFLATLAAGWWLYQQVPSEYAPKEDRGAFFIAVNGPEGASFEYMTDYMDEIEARLLPYLERGEFQRLLVRAPRGFGRIESFNSGFVVVGLAPWGERPGAWDIMAELRRKFADLPGVRVVPIMRQSLGGGSSVPVQFVISGGTYDQLARWRDTLMKAIRADNPGLVNLDDDYKETKPQIAVSIDRDRAGDLGVSVSTVGRALETFMGGRAVTTFIADGKEYDVLVEGEKSDQRTPTDINNIYVRSDASGVLVPLADLVKIDEYAGPSQLNRYNRLRSITISANLAEGYSLGQALDWLTALARAKLPEQAVVDYKGQSRDFKESGGSLTFVFMLGIVVVFLALAAQFESFVHPVVIMLTVPLAVAGALAGIWLTGGTLNIYTQIGLIMLVGLAAKNGILIVEFINQLREEGLGFAEAVIEASGIRLRPILMTAITTAAGAVPLILSGGAGAETRSAIGVVILAGVISSTLLTLFIIPLVYYLVARGTPERGAVARQLDDELERHRRPLLTLRPGKRDAAE